VFVEETDDSETTAGGTDEVPGDDSLAVDELDEVASSLVVEDELEEARVVALAELDADPVDDGKLGGPAVIVVVTVVWAFVETCPPATGPGGV
jgi:hypothetical protein